MPKTITYKKVQAFIDEYIKPRIECFEEESPFKTEEANKIYLQYVRFVWAGLNQYVPVRNRVWYESHCMTFVLWLKSSVRRFEKANPTYDLDKNANRHVYMDSEPIRQRIVDLRDWFVDEFMYCVSK